MGVTKIMMACMMGLATIAGDAAYTKGERMDATAAADGKKIVIEAASTVTNYGYYVGETASNECHWQLGLRQTAVWQLEQADDASHYYIKNAVSGRYVGPCPKTAGTAKTVEDRTAAALFVFYDGATSPWAWTDYNDQNKYPRGWDEGSWMIYDLSADYAWRNDAGRQADGNLWYGSGTHIGMWNVYEAVESMLPVADVLDIEFGANGAVADVSPMGNSVVRKGTVASYYNSRYGRYVARFSNSYGGSTSSFYKVDYAASRTDGRMAAALKDGHSLESVFCTRIATEDKEAKWFSSHQQGGTGFLVCKRANGKDGGNEITFLPYVGGYKWATSGVVPEVDVFYHVVGVWDKTAGKARIYVNGQLMNEVAASGNLNLSSNDIYHWFGIGADPSAADGANTSGSWDIVSCKIYDEVLTSDEVGRIYNELINRTGRKSLHELIDKARATITIVDETERTEAVSNYETTLALCENAVEDETMDGTALLSMEHRLREALDGVLIVADYAYPDGYNFVDGCHFPVYSGSFEGNEVISLGTGNSVVVADTVQIIDRGARIRLPEGCGSGTYTVSVSRGGLTQQLGSATLVKADKMPKPARAVAHRGWWTKDGGTSQNSRAAVRNAFEAGFYGCEIDVHETTDGHIMVNHDFSIGGVVINQSTYDQVNDKTLSNGEKIPQLSDFFDIMKNEYPDSPTKLIIELKVNANTDTLHLANAVVDAVREAGLQDRVEYISFGVSALKYVRQADPEAFTQSLTSMRPAEIKDNGIQALDFNYTSFNSNPTWIAEADELGLLIDVFTIDDRANMVRFNNLGVDLITTNYPDQVQEVYNLTNDMMPSPLNDDDDPLGLFSQDAGSIPHILSIYSPAGMRLSSVHRGINILQMSNGTSQKVFVK